MIVYTSEGYFDPNDPDGPIKFRLNKDMKVPVQYGGYTERRYGLVSNTVVKSDGSNDKFYDIESLGGADFPIASVYCSIAQLFISDRYNYFEMYIDYQPSTDRRNLESVEAGNLMSIEYFIFYLLSQIGGLYAF